MANDNIHFMTELYRGCGWINAGLDVIPTRGANKLATARSLGTAGWICRRLRDADIAEAKVAELKLQIEGQREGIQRLARQLREAEERETNLRRALQRDEVMSNLRAERLTAPSLTAEVVRRYEAMEGLCGLAKREAQV